MKDGYICRPSIAGVYVALLLNRSLRHWDTAEFRMTGEIVKIILGGILFLLSQKSLGPIKN